MKRYLITGASRGIGRAIAEKLTAPDVTLLLHGRDTIALAETCKSVKSRCPRVISLIHDLAVGKGVSDLIAEVGDEPLDLLVNNAGVAVVKPFGEITQVEWEQTLGVNVTAPFLLMQRFAPQMPPGASIVNILSIAAKTGFANWSNVAGNWLREKMISAAQVADAVAFALAQPPDVLVENITLGNLVGDL